MKITAQEFFADTDEFEKIETREQEKVCIKAMIEFAKRHVQEALKQASEKVKIQDKPFMSPHVDKDSIINAYPLDNIK